MCMKVYLSHISALDYWRTQQAAGNPRPASSPVQFAPVAPCDNVEWSDLLDSPPISGVPRPLHLLIRENQHHQYDRDVRFHRVTVDPPSRGFVRLSREIRVATPEYAFLQIARSFPFSRLVALGYELCGTYSLRPWEEGRPARYHCVPLTNPDRLRRFAQVHKSRRGGSVAYRAAALVKGSSGSPMETVLVLLLCLPVRMGGYGLPWPQLNKQVMVRDGAGAPRPRYCDLCWPGYALEYEGAPYHAAPAKQVADSARRIDLGLEHMDVNTVFYAQIEDPVAFERLAKVTARHIGWRLRPAALAPTEARWRLRADLLEGIVSPVRDPGRRKAGSDCRGEV